MKWKTALTAEEAALLATDLQGERALVRLHPAPVTQINPDLAVTKRNTQIITAHKIYDALIQDIYLADPYEEFAVKGATSPLVIAMRVQQSEHDNYIAAEKCTATKLSLAKWFWQHDQEMAKKFWPSITDEIVHPPQPMNSTTPANATTSPKGYNSLHKTIALLSDALINGRSGKPNTDAEAVLAVLAQKASSASEPVDKKTLAKYLKAAYELDS